jgi:predicted nucleotidyltransferase
MPIPALTSDGFLPEGVHNCTLAEIGERFGRFQKSDRRCRLFDRLAEYLRDAKTSGIVRAVIVNGSFVMGKDNPSDVDLIVVSLPGSVLPTKLRPVEYNVLSKRVIRRQFGMDVLSAQEGELEVDEHIDFFSQVRNRPEIRKGMLRIVL